MPQGILEALNFVWESGSKIRPLAIAPLSPRAIAPDLEYSHPGYTRVFYYRRPAKFFAHDFYSALSIFQLYL
jgi:hypothetical protein